MWSSLREDHHLPIEDVTHCSGPFLCFAGLPPAVLLLYWAGLPPAVLGPSVLSKGVETGPTGTQIGLASRKLCLACQEHAYGS